MLIFSRPSPNNFIWRGQLCPLDCQVHQSDPGLYWARGEIYQLSDGGVQSWLSDQELPSQGGGDLSLCSPHYQTSLHRRGRSRWGCVRDKYRKTVFRWEPVALRISTVLRDCQDGREETLGNVWSDVREPLWTSPSWALPGRRLWWTTSSENINDTNILSLRTSVIHKLWEVSGGHWVPPACNYDDILDIVFNSQLKLVQISFSSSTFDRINKESWLSFLLEN